MDSINFSTFTVNGVELSDTLSTWRKKTNGIISKITPVQTGGQVKEGEMMFELEDE